MLLLLSGNMRSIDMPLPLPLPLLLVLLLLAFLARNNSCTGWERGHGMGTRSGAVMGFHKSWYVGCHHGNNKYGFYT